MFMEIEGHLYGEIVLIEIDIYWMFIGMGV